MQLAATVMLEQLTGSAEALKEKEKEVAGSSDVLRTWATQYSLPSEESDAARPGLKNAYKPPPSDTKGITMALAVIGSWAAVFLHAIFQIKLPTSLDQLHWLPVSDATAQLVGGSSSLMHIVVVFFVLEFLYTGLFITTHDAMHGTIAMRNRQLNDFLGRVCISLYAWFDYNMLHRKHWEHHNHTGEVGKDPDFHRGNPGIVPWFASFMSSYMSMWQFARLAWWTVVMQLLGAPMANLLVFMAAAPILSAFRLFYFGTYMPHKPEPSAASGSPPVVMNWWKSRTSQASDLVSFLTCYHFDLHWEHHRWPFAPWWELPNCRRLSGRGLVPA
ncbi:beta-carotene C-4 oxygenase [Haematococcus lacustris]|uniref:Beta-carotene C-4 oxygenase n=3 Tax=Haematococcus lacustris TaxID=44745 RepID=Q4FE71_HAELA|nr:beta-carotene C-4 oxygenase [Haematococcus lacustris]